MRVLVFAFLCIAGIFSFICLLINKTLSSEEIADKAAFFHHILRNWPNNSNNSRQQTLNTIVLEKNIASKQLSQDASETPNVNLVVVAASKDDLGRSVRPRLDVAAQVIVDKT
jgi:hypothetical protein